MLQGICRNLLVYGRMEDHGQPSFYIFVVRVVSFSLLCLLDASCPNKRHRKSAAAGKDASPTLCGQVLLTTNLRSVFGQFTWELKGLVSVVTAKLVLDLVSPKRAQTTRVLMFVCVNHSSQRRRQALRHLDRAMKEQ